jgi:methylamine dehydrogenase accessory protein MauD
MDGVWLISYVALWCLTLVLGLVVLAHSRLLGLLHHRIRPAGARALADGPEIGSKRARLGGEALDGSAWAWDFPAPSDLLAVFVSPQCQLCNDLMPHVKDFVRTRRDVHVVLLSTLGDRVMNCAYVAYRRLGGLRYIAAPALAEELRVDGTPYAVYFSREGVVAAKGIVNHYEHLDSLRLMAASGGAGPPAGPPHPGGSGEGQP